MPEIVAMFLALNRCEILSMLCVTLITMFACSKCSGKKNVAMDNQIFKHVLSLSFHLVFGFLYDFTDFQSKPATNL